VGTVRGTFDLNARPASSALRKLREEGTSTDVVMRRVGDSLDSIGTTKQREQVRLYREGLKLLGRQFEQSAGKATASWDQMERKTLDAVATQSAAIDSLQGRVDELGRSSPTISVNTRGVAESIAEVELLQRRLNELGRSRPTARVGVGGVASSVMRTTAARSAGGGGFGGGFKVPLAGSIPYPLLAGALGAAPPLLGGAGALLGSAGSAALGGGAIGLAGLGALGAGIGSIASVAIPAVKGLNESYKALTAYNKAVAQNGKNSTQAHTALEKLNAALQSAPSGTRGLLNREQRLSSRFQRLTQPAQGSFIGSLSNLLGAGNKLTPQLAGIANPLLASGQRQSGRLSNFLTGPTTRGFLGASGSTAIEVLPDVESTFQHVLGTLMNISRASMPFFKQSVEWLEKWTGGWADSTGNIDKTRRSIGGMVSNLKSWGRLTGATFDLLKDIFSSGTRPGQSLVDDLTRQLNTWDAWIKRNPRQVRAFFSEAVDSTEKIAGALGKIAGLVWKLGRLLTPLLTQLSQFVGFLGNMGLLEAGSLPLLLAGGAGIRNAVGGARARILGTGGGAAGLGTSEAAVIGASAGGGGVGFRGMLGTGRSYLGGIGNAYSRAGRIPVAGAGGTLGAEADAGLIGATTFSRTAGLRGAGRFVLPGALRLGGGFLRGAAARYLPIAGIMAGIEALGGENLQNVLSHQTFGLVPHHYSGKEKQETTSRALQGLYEQIGAPGEGGVSAQRRAISSLEAQRGGDFLTGTPASGDSDSMHEARGHIEAALPNYRRALGESIGSRFGQAFNIYRKGQGGKAAFAEVTKPILREITALGPQGGKALSRSVLSWATTARRANPALKKQFEELAGGIEARFARMGQRIKIINGEIYTGSRREWGNIEQAMSNPVERAKQQVSADFTAIQKQAVNSLRAMGYSPSMAKRIVGGLESNNNQTREAAEGSARSGPGGYNQKILRGEASGPPQAHPRGARGMRIPGYGNTDHVPIGGYTGIGAPGELIINPHTEARANRLLGAFGVSLEQMQKGEKYRASTPVGQMYGRPGEGFARGGRMGGSATAWRGIGPAGLHSGIRKVAAAVLGQFPGLSVTSTTGGGHVSGSYHYLGEAVDIAGSTGVMNAAANWIKRSGLYRQLTEGIHNPNLSVSDGHMVDPSFYSSVWAEHANHIHLAVAHAVGKLLGLSGGRGRARGFGGLGGKSIRLKGRKSGLGGAPGALVEAGTSAYAKGLEQHINKQIGGGRGRGGGFGRVSGGSVPAQIARVLSRGGLNKVGAAGIIGNAYAESSWNPAATGYGGGGLWGFTASPNSLADLQAYAQQRNQPWTSAALQSQFLLQHVSRGLISRLNSASSPEAAAALFMSEWERPGIPRQSVREEGARKAFKMGFARGGRLPRWGGWNALGGSGSFDRPTLLGVGERGREDVEIRPHRPERKRAGGRQRLRGNVEVHFHGDVHVRKDSDLDAIADKVGRKLVAAMAEDDGIDQDEVIG
jgi:hypothetical protein